LKNEIIYFTISGLYFQYIAANYQTTLIIKFIQIGAACKSAAINLDFGKLKWDAAEHLSKDAV